MTISRFATFLSLAAVLGLTPFLSGDADPWARNELMQPGELASLLKSGHPAPTVICTAFPVLYRQRHILHAKLAGPGSKPEGIEELRKLVAGLPKNTDLVLYCGCCPMDRCPNIRPAYQALKDLGFTHIRVLSMPTNFHTDWSSKDYPVE